MRAILLALLLAGCATPSGGATLHFHIANEALEDGAEVRVTLTDGDERVEEARNVSFDPVVPSDAFSLRWGAGDVAVQVDVPEAGRSAAGAFDLGGQDEWWFYVAVYRDRVHLERFAQEPAFH